MDIKKYAGYFHDGSIEMIRHSGENIDILMGSAEVSAEENEDNIELSKDFCINGILHIEGVIQIKENNQLRFNKLRMENDAAEIFDLEIGSHCVAIDIAWYSLPPKPCIDDLSVIEIEAEKIWWENIPDLLDEDS